MSTINEPIGFAVIGHGNIGKRHAEMIRRNSGAKLLAVVDTRSKADTKFNDEQVYYFNSTEDFLKSDSAQLVDVVNIATPNGLHSQQAIEFLQAKKHVVIEKPMALNRADAEKIIFKAFEMHKHVFVVMQNRYSPPSIWIKKMIDSGRLGKIFMVQLNCYWNRDDRYYSKGNWHGTKDLDGGVLYTQFSHFLDILYWLFGDVKNIEGRSSNFNHQSNTEFIDSGIVNFEFVNGGIGSINFSTSIWDKNLESSITIIAENGSIKIGGQYMNEVVYCHVKDYVMPQLASTEQGNDYGAYKGSAANHHFVIDNVVDVLRGKSSITTNALEGLKVVDIIERINNAAH